MSQREWHYPDRRRGLTFAVVTDTHFGRRTWQQAQLGRVGADLDRLAPYADAMLHGGDCIHWGTATPEDDQATPWIAARKTTFPNFLDGIGNHDESSYTDPYPHRTAAERAPIYSLTSQNNVLTLDEQAVFLGVGPDQWWWDTGIGNWPAMPLTSDTIDWLDAQLAATDLPCWLVTHAPPNEQYDGHIDADTQTALDGVVGAHDNLVGWVSGHRHADLADGTSGLVTTITAGGREIFAINCPATGGGVAGGPGYGTPGDRWDNPVWSTWVTWDGDTVTARFRDHLHQSWWCSTSGVFTATATLAGAGD